MPFVKGSWTGQYYEEGNEVIFKLGAQFTNENAQSFMDYWNNNLTKTGTTNEGAIPTGLSDGVNTRIVVSDKNGRLLTIHEKPIDDIKTVEDALFNAVASITTANAAANTYADAGTKITFDSGPA